MRDIGQYRQRAAALGAIFLLSSSLSGCVAAAVPLMGVMGVGMAAVSGFEMYKVVQLQGGGSIRIEFPSKDGKPVPPQPLPALRRVAVWPGDEGDVRFADRLQSSARFSSVVAPAAVATILAETKTPVDLKQLTELERGEAFDRVCQRTRVEFVFAGIGQGVSENSNSFSFQRANITYTADLLGYSCEQHKIAWRDKIALVIDVAGSVSNTGAMNQAAADAWAERIMASMAQPTAARAS